MSCRAGLYRVTSCRVASCCMIVVHEMFCKLDFVRPGVCVCVCVQRSDFGSCGAESLCRGSCASQSWFDRPACPQAHLVCIRVPWQHMLFARNVDEYWRRQMRDGFKSLFETNKLDLQPAEPHLSQQQQRNRFRVFLQVPSVRCALRAAVACH